LKKANIAEEYGTIYQQNMVPFSPAIWYHILHQYGTIFYRNMVPYSFMASPLLKINKAKTRFQNKPFSSSKRLWLFCWAVWETIEVPTAQWRVFFYYWCAGILSFVISLLNGLYH
jgi:hypothetical protein